MAIRLVLADDSYIIREGVRELIRGLDGIEVVAVCSDFDSLNDAIAREIRWSAAEIEIGQKGPYDQLFKNN